MSMAFPRRMGEIPRIPDKGVGAVLTRNNDAALGKPATRLNYPRATCPAGVALVRLDDVSCVRDHERFDELLLRELRDRSRDRRHGGTCRARGRSATPWPAPDRAISGRIPVLSAPIPAERDVLGHAIRPVRRMDEGLPAILRRVLGPGRRDRCAFRRPFVRLLLYAVAAFVFSAILTSIVTGAMTEYAVRRYRGEPMTVKQALRRGLTRFPSILGANILLGLILFGLVTLPLLLILVALLAGLSGATGTIALLCGGLGLFVGLGVVAIYLYVSLVLYAPAFMMENANAVGGLSRSWRMTRGHRWSLFGAILIVSILGGVIGTVISVPLAFASSAGDPIVSAFVSVLSSALISAFVGSWTVILVAVAYALIVRRPTPFFGAAPPYLAGPGIAPPPGAAQTASPPPSGPPPGP